VMGSLPNWGVHGRLIRLHGVSLALLGALILLPSNLWAVSSIGKLPPIVFQMKQFFLKSPKMLHRSISLAYNESHASSSLATSYIFCFSNKIDINIMEAWDHVFVIE